MRNVQFIFGGLPGCGKSELANYLAQVTGAVYLRIDSIEQALRAAGESFIGPEGYEIAYRLAADNLQNGLSVVADSVNPIELTRFAWRRVAEEARVEFRQIEVTCSDKAEHRMRIEARKSDVPGLKLLSWDDVLHREYEVWADADIVIDTAGETPQQSKAKLEKLLGFGRRGE